MGRAALGVALATQLVVLYLPRAPAGPQVSGTDKLIHLLVFAVPAALVLLARLRPWWLLVLALHGPVSELVQHVLLPHRSGDWRDAVADGLGVVVGAGVVMVGRRLRR